MPSKNIDQLIINPPYEEPREYWKRDSESKLFSRVPGRRPAGYIRATESSKAIDDPGIFIELPLPNKIRPRVNSWREASYPGVSGITKRLLDHWRDPEQRENRRLFFGEPDEGFVGFELTEEKAAAFALFGVAPVVEETFGDAGNAGLASLAPGVSARAGCVRECK